MEINEIVVHKNPNGRIVEGTLEIGESRTKLLIVITDIEGICFDFDYELTLSDVLLITEEFKLESLPDEGINGISREEIENFLDQKVVFELRAEEGSSDNEDDEAGEEIMEDGI